MTVKTFFQTKIKVADIEPKAKQMKKKRKQKKRKNNSKVDISESNTHRSEHDTTGIPLEVESSNQRLNNNENSEFED